MSKELTRAEASAVASANDAEIRRVISHSLYPGAKPESITMVLDYCRAAKLNPLLKPVHIVPMSVKNGTNYVWRDVVMPGIGHYRTQAARTGEYLGKSEPIFGPETTKTMSGVEVTFPLWCKVTVLRKVGGMVAEFTATEYWTENYATAKRESQAPNAMWKKRPYGQLHKCAEAQALRMAFPELLGGTNTAEEMEGKEIDPVDLGPDGGDAPASKTEVKTARAKAAKQQLDGFANTKAADPDDDAIDGTAREIMLPSMPDDAADALKAGRWGKAWVWLCEQEKTLDGEARSILLGQHRTLIEMAAAKKQSAKVAGEFLSEITEKEPENDDPETQAEQ